METDIIARQLTLELEIEGKPVVVPVIYYEEDFEQYRPVWDKADVDEVWYEKLGFHARGFMWGDTMHLWKAAPDVVGHEALHKAGKHHPNTALASFVHAFKVGFNWEAFSGLFRRKDTHGIEKACIGFCARLKTGEGDPV